MLMVYPVATIVRIGATTVVFDIDWIGSQRIVHLGAEHPQIWSRRCKAIRSAVGKATCSSSTLSVSQRTRKASGLRCRRANVSI